VVASKIEQTLRRSRIWQPHWISEAGKRNVGEGKNMTNLRYSTPFNEMKQRNHKIQKICIFEHLIFLLNNNLLSPLYFKWDTGWRSWLMHCTTRRKVAGSISDGVIGIFRWLNPSGVDQASTRNEYQEHFLGLRAVDA
jgi:hypothetical protein